MAPETRCVAELLNSSLAAKIWCSHWTDRRITASRGTVFQTYHQGSWIYVMHVYICIHSIYIYIHRYVYITSMFNTHIFLLVLLLSLSLVCLSLLLLLLSVLHKHCWSYSQCLYPYYCYYCCSDYCYSCMQCGFQAGMTGKQNMYLV